MKRAATIRYQGVDGPTRAAIRGVFRRVDPLLPPAKVQKATEILSESLGQANFQAFFLLSLAVVALILAAVGLSGLVSGSVLERTEELGLRLALGAKPSRALGAVAPPMKLASRIPTETDVAPITKRSR